MAFEDIPASPCCVQVEVITPWYVIIQEPIFFVGIASILIVVILELVVVKNDENN